MNHASPDPDTRPARHRLAVGWNKKGNYTQVIADATEAIRLKTDVALYNLLGSAY
jgi:hypothetical protein